MRNELNCQYVGIVPCNELGSPGTPNGRFDPPRHAVVALRHDE